MNAETLRLEEEALEKKCVQLQAALQQAQGALGFCRHLRKKAEAANPPELKLVEIDPPDSVEAAHATTDLTPAG